MITIFQHVPRIQVLLVTTHKNYNTPMNDKKLQAVKGLDNPLEIQILNSDRKPVDLTGKTVKFTVSKIRANSIFIEKVMTAQNAAKGIYSGVITTDEIYEIPQGLAQLAFYVEDDETGVKTPLFKNISGGYAIDLDIINGPYTIPQDDIRDDYGSVATENNSIEDYGSVEDYVEIAETDNI